MPSHEQNSIRQCKPEPPKIPSSQLQPRDERIQVDHLAVTEKGVVPVQQDLLSAPAREICVISASVLALPLVSNFVSSRDRMAEL